MPRRRGVVSGVGWLKASTGRSSGTDLSHPCCEMLRSVLYRAGVRVANQAGGFRSFRDCDDATCVGGQCATTVKASFPTLHGLARPLILFGNILAITGGVRTGQKDPNGKAHFSLRLTCRILRPLPETRQPQNLTANSLHHYDLDWIPEKLAQD